MKKIIIPVLVGLLATSCTTLYHPQLEAIPLVQEQGELALETGMSKQDAFAGNISVAYGLTDKVALSGFARTSQNSEGRNFHTQLAAGLYDKTEKGLIREVYAGLAAGVNSDSWGIEAHDRMDAEGNLFSSEIYDQSYYLGNYQMAFVQGNIGKRNKHFEWAFGLKLGGMHSLIDHTLSLYQYSVPDATSSTGLRDIFTDDINPYNNGNNYNNFSLLLQPQLELRFGWEKFKFTYRLALGMQFGLPEKINMAFFGHFNSGFGIMYRF